MRELAIGNSSPTLLLSPPPTPLLVFPLHTHTTPASDSHPIRAPPDTHPPTAPSRPRCKLPLYVTVWNVCVCLFVCVCVYVWCVCLPMSTSVCLPMSVRQCLSTQSATTALQEGQSIILTALSFFFGCHRKVKNRGIAPTTMDTTQTLWMAS